MVFARDGTTAVILTGAFYFFEKSLLQFTRFLRISLPE